MKSELVMAGKKISVLCHSGGEIVTLKDDTLSYKGGFAHAIDIDVHTKFDKFQTEVAEMFNCRKKSISIYYVLPISKTDLITISSDKDLKYMIISHENFLKANIYVVVKKSIAQKLSNMLW